MTMKDGTDLATKIFRMCELVYGNNPGTYIEAGAHDGISHSNTVRLEHDLGWQGILVEPGIPAFELLIQNRSKNLNLNKALVDSVETKVLSGTFSSGSLLSSAHPQLKYRDTAKLKHKFRGIARLRKTIGLNPKVREIEVEATTLDDVISNSGFSEINLLSLDVEGMEYQSLSGLRTSRPEIIVVETREINIWSICELMLTKHYVLVGEILSDLNGKIVAEHKDLVWVTSTKVDLVRRTVQALQSLA